MKILSSFTHLQVVQPTLCECLCSAEHKGIYFEESLLLGCFGALLTSKVGKNTMKVNAAQEPLCFPHSSEYLRKPTAHPLSAIISRL